MMKARAVVLLAGVFSAGVALAEPSAGESLARKSDCFSCHATDRRIVGPAFRDVAAKYRGNASAPARLVAKVRAGGAGVWGPVPMTPHRQLSDKDLRQIVAWVLTVK